VMVDPLWRDGEVLGYVFSLNRMRQGSHHGARPGRGRGGQGAVGFVGAGRGRAGRGGLAVAAPAARGPFCLRALVRPLARICPLTHP
jgi:hypothetical protein